MAKASIADYNAALTVEQRVANAKRAAAASGEARARHRLFKDILKDILALPIDNEDVAYEQLKKLGMELSVKLFEPKSIEAEMDVNSIAMVYFNDSYGGFTIDSGGTGLGNSSFRVSA